LSRSDFWPEARKQLVLASPIVLGQVGQNLIGLTDTLFVGRLGSVALGASAFANSVFVIFLVFGIGVLAPLAPLFAQIEGRGARAEASNLLKHAVLVTAAISLVLILLLYFLLPLLPFFGQTQEVLDHGRNFYIIISWSLLPTLFFQVYRQFTDGIGETKVAMLVMFLGVLLNIAGNALLIPWLGLDGSAYSTLISRSLMALALLIYIHKNKNFRAYLPQKWDLNFHLGTLLHTLRLGIPNGFTVFFEVGAFASAAIMIGWFGTVPLAAHQIAISLASTTFLVALGIGIASGIRVGFELGQGNPAAARHAGFVSIQMGFIFMAVCAVLFYAFRFFLPGLYIDDPEVIRLAASFLTVVALFEVFDGVQSVAIGSLRGLSDTRWPSVLAFIAYWVLGLPLGYWMAFHAGWGPVGIWVGLLAGLVFISIFLTLRFHLLSRPRETKTINV
jgi:MATE family multidrug resistance protein